MVYRKKQGSAASWERSEVECAHCGLPLIHRGGAAAGGAYFSCTRCDRIYASSYDEALRQGAGIRPAGLSSADPERDARFEEVKRRLEAFLRRLDDDDDWFVLGVAPGTPLEEVRTQYRALALAHHPDRGGDPVRMQRITRAFERIRSGRSRPPRERAIKPPPVDDESRVAVAIPAVKAKTSRG